MVKKLNKLISWYMITIDDAPKNLSGKSFFDLLLTLSSIMNFKFAITDSIEGCGKDWVVSDFQKKRNRIIPFDELLAFFCNVNQFDWGDFFLFKEYPHHWSNPEGKLYPFVVSQSDTTIRAVDDQYIYIYSPYKEIVDIIKENYTIEEVKLGTLDSLDFPE